MKSVFIILLFALYPALAWAADSRETPGGLFVALFLGFCAYLCLRQIWEAVSFLFQFIREVITGDRPPKTSRRRL